MLSHLGFLKIRSTILSPWDNLPFMVKPEPEDSDLQNANRSLGRSKFQTLLAVRPDDIDMHRHVHSSKYWDYVLAARYDQMERYYGMSMGEFHRHGYTWFVKTAHMEYKRPLVLEDQVVVSTWIESFIPRGVRVHFELNRYKDGKRSCEGWCEYVLIDLETGRAEKIPDWIWEKYAI